MQDFKIISLVSFFCWFLCSCCFYQIRFRQLILLFDFFAMCSWSWLTTTNLCKKKWERQKGQKEPFCCGCYLQSLWFLVENLSSANRNRFHCFINREQNDDETDYLVFKVFKVVCAMSKERMKRLTMHA